MIGPDRRAGLWIAVLICGVQPLGAQTPITSVGLGYRVEPVDGRAAALGGTGIGLLGGTFSLRNPADLLLHAEPGFGISFSGESVTVEGDGGSLDTGRERFTTIRALVPFSGWAVGLAFGAEFDQDWSIRFQDTLVLADGSVPFEETREHDGGISSIDLSVARRLGPVGVGVSPLPIATGYPPSAEMSLTCVARAQPHALHGVLGPANRRLLPV